MLLAAVCAAPRPSHRGPLLPYASAMDSYAMEALSASTASTWWVGHETELQHCRPKQDALWFVGTDHKTGTVEFLSFFQQVTQLQANASALVYDLSMPGTESRTKRECGAQESPFATPCLRGAEEQGGIMMAIHAAQHIPTRQQYLEAYARESPGRSKILLAYSSRSPLEVIRSSYLYHVACPEPWCSDAMTNESQTIQADVLMACEASPCADCVPLDTSVCSHEAFKSVSGSALSYQSLLQHFPPMVGVMIEAWHMLDQLLDMQDALSALQGDSSAVVVDLDTIMGSGCEQELERMFRHLDSEGSPSTCARLACADATEGSASSHSTAGTPTRLKTELLAHLMESSWITERLGAVTARMI